MGISISSIEASSLSSAVMERGPYRSRHATHLEHDQPHGAEADTCIKQWRVRAAQRHRHAHTSAWLAQHHIHGRHGEQTVPDTPSGTMHTQQTSQRSRKHHATFRRLHGPSDGAFERRRVGNMRIPQQPPRASDLSDHNRCNLRQRGGPKAYTVRACADSLADLMRH